MTLADELEENAKVLDTYAPVSWPGLSTAAVEAIAEDLRKAAAQLRAMESAPTWDDLENRNDAPPAHQEDEP